MIITLVMDQFGQSNNGTTVTAMRFAKILKTHGHEVRIVASLDKNSEMLNEFKTYGVECYKIPIFDNLIREQGMVFGKPDDEILKKAIEGSDVVHLFLPFAIQRHARLIAKEMGIATTAAFHLQPENITYTCFVGKIKKINDILYTYFRRSFYRYFNHIHCPSVMIRDQLVKHKYKGNLHVISNGVDPAFKHMEVAKPEELKSKYVILMVGRLSREKRQDILIEAIGKSKYNKDIQLILCGKGPWKNALQKLSNKHLANPVKFQFLPQPELLNVINYSDLYVHASDAEIEAISCMEAFTCGLVPIISNSEYTATKQFAQDPHCLFEKGNSDSLREQIDYFYEHPEIKAELSKKYIEYAKQYALDYCVTALEKVFEKAIEENSEKKKNGVGPDFTKKELRKLKKIDDQFVKKMKREQKEGHIHIKQIATEEKVEDEKTDAE